MVVQSGSRLERQTQEHFIYRVNTLIEEGQDDLARQLVTEARRELADATLAKEPTD
jgi:hypothetical protein